MAGKALKITRAKGERLGWTPIGQVKQVTMRSVTVHVRKLSMCQRTNQQASDVATSKFLIP